MTRVFSATDHRPRLRRRGFTLVEVMIAAALGIIVVAGVSQMFLSVYKINFVSLAKLDINRDIRSFTNRLTRDAWSAREYRIYAAHNDLTRRESGQTGDVLVLVWALPEPIEAAANSSDMEYFYERVIVYARIVDDVSDNTGPVLRFERTFALPGSSGGGTKASEVTVAAVTADILNQKDNQRRVVEITRGLADQRLFFHSRTGRSITVNGEIYHGNKAKQVTNTYNFTVNPRG